MSSESIYDRPLKPTKVTVEEGLPSPQELMVDEDDLTNTFGDRVRIERRWNSDNNVITRYAHFDSPLSSAEIAMIEWMSDEFRHRRQTQGQSELQSS